jgi:leucyl aminopeptidase (aminopeptidase T)
MTDNPNNWTIAALKEYFDQYCQSTEIAITKAENAAEQRVQAVQMAVNKAEEKLEQRFQALQLAVNKAEIATEKRFEGVNEFREQLSDQSRTFIPRMEFENIHKNLNEKVDSVTKKLDKVENVKQGGSNVWALIISIISFIGVIFSIIIGMVKL